MITCKNQNVFLQVLAQRASPGVVSALSSYLGHTSMFLEMSNHFLKGLIVNITFLWQQKSHAEELRKTSANTCTHSSKTDLTAVVNLVQLNTRVLWTSRVRWSDGGFPVTAVLLVDILMKVLYLRSFFLSFLNVYSRDFSFRYWLGRKML